MMNTPISKKEISSHLKFSPSIPVYVFDCLDSTNAFAKTLTEDYALVACNHQTNGRGRLNRSFYSPKGSGVYFTLKAKVPNLYDNVAFVTTLASVAVHKAIKELCNIDCGIKWVNDIYLKDKKVSGILCEAVDSSHAIIGVGINLYASPFPDELKDIATALFEKQAPIKKDELIARVTDNLLSLLSTLPDTSFMEYYKSHSIVIGKSIVCIQGDKAFNAVATGITSDGALVIECDNGTKQLRSGEISIRFN